MIEGVKLFPLTTHSDDRGHLLEIYSTATDYHKEFGGTINQVYIVEDGTQLTSIASHTYNPENPDEERIPFDSFGYDWTVQFK